MDEDKRLVTPDIDMTEWVILTLAQVGVVILFGAFCWASAGAILHLGFNVISEQALGSAHAQGAFVIGVIGSVFYFATEGIADKYSI